MKLFILSYGPKTKAQNSKNVLTVTSYNAKDTDEGIA